MSFQCIHMPRPEPPELSQPGIHLLKRFGLQPVEPPLRIHRGFHETSLPQHPQVLGNGRLRHPKAPLDLPNGLFSGNQQAQYRPPVRLCNDFEDGFHSRNIRNKVYTCQGM